MNRVDIPKSSGLHQPINFKFRSRIFIIPFVEENVILLSRVSNIAECFEYLRVLLVQRSIYSICSILVVIPSIRHIRVSIAVSLPDTELTRKIS